MAADPRMGANQSPGSESKPAPAGRHSLREQDQIWSELLSLAEAVVDTLDKSVQTLCEARFELISEVEDEEEESDRREVRIEQECLRILALYEPVASDLRRMATVLKVNRDWERIADLALRVARRARKLRARQARWRSRKLSSRWRVTCWPRYAPLTRPLPVAMRPLPGS